MPSLPDLPTEILLAIATTLRMVASLARTNRRLYNILTPALYGHHVSHSSPTRSCILWGALNGRLGTVKLCHQHGGSLDLDIKDTNWPQSGAIKSWAGDSWDYVTNCGTPLQLAVRYGHPDIVAYLLEHGADVHAPSLACCHCRSLGRLSYPLHEVVCDTPSGLRHRRNRKMDETVANDLMQRGAYLEGPGRPVLHSLIMQDRLNLIVPLLEHRGCSAWDGTSMQSTPLHVAGEFGRTGIARVLLAQADISVHALDGARCTAAERAAWGGHISTLRVLLEAESGPGVPPRGPVRALNAAAASGQLGVVKVLLDEYEVSASEQNARGQTPLHLAAKAGHVDVVKVLIRKREVDVSAVCPSGMMAIHYAAMSEPEESAVLIIQALVGAGADVNARVSSTGEASTPLKLPLRYAIEWRKPIVALALLSLGADPSLENGPDPRTGLSLLHHCLAPESGHLTKTEVRLVKELISRGVDFESTSTSTTVFSPRADGPPLFFAAVYARSDVCLRALLEAGASAGVPRIDVPSPFGTRPKTLLNAVFCHRLARSYHRNVEMVQTNMRLDDVRPVQACVKLLLEHGARLDGEVPGDQSALEYACEVAMDANGCFELLCVLLRSSTGRNVSFEHLEVVKARYSPRESGDRPSEDRNTVQRRGRVFRQLSDFGKKAFKQRVVGRR